MTIPLTANNIPSVNSSSRKPVVESRAKASLAVQKRTAKPAPVEKTSRRREEILQVAALLFAAKGYEETTIREIGDAAGILSGSLYHLFQTK